MPLVGDTSTRVDRRAERFDRAFCALGRQLDAILPSASVASPPNPSSRSEGGRLRCTVHTVERKAAHSGMWSPTAARAGCPQPCPEKDESTFGNEGTRCGHRSLDESPPAPATAMLMLALRPPSLDGGRRTVTHSDAAVRDGADERAAHDITAPSSTRFAEANDCTRPREPPPVDGRPRTAFHRGVILEALWDVIAAVDTVATEEEEEGASASLANDCWWAAVARFRCPSASRRLASGDPSSDGGTDAAWGATIRCEVPLTASRLVRRLYRDGTRAIGNIPRMHLLLAAALIESVVEGDLQVNAGGFAVATRAAKESYAVAVRRTLGERAQPSAATAGALASALPEAYVGMMVDTALPSSVVADAETIMVMMSMLTAAHRRDRGGQPNYGNNKHERTPSDGTSTTMKYFSSLLGEAFGMDAVVSAVRQEVASTTASARGGDGKQHDDGDDGPITLSTALVEGGLRWKGENGHVGDWILWYANIMGTAIGVQQCDSRDHLLGLIVQSRRQSLKAFRDAVAMLRHRGIFNATEPPPSILLVPNGDDAGRDETVDVTGDIGTSSASSEAIDAAIRDFVAVVERARVELFAPIAAICAGCATKGGRDTATEGPKPLPGGLGTSSGPLNIGRWLAAAFEGTAPEWLSLLSTSPDADQSNTTSSRHARCAGGMNVLVYSDCAELVDAVLPSSLHGLLHARRLTYSAGQRSDTAQKKSGEEWPPMARPEGDGSAGWYRLVAPRTAPHAAARDNCCPDTAGITLYVVSVADDPKEAVRRAALLAPACHAALLLLRPYPFRSGRQRQSVDPSTLLEAFEEDPSALKALRRLPHVVGAARVAEQVDDGVPRRRVPSTGVADVAVAGNASEHGPTSGRVLATSNLTSSARGAIVYDVMHALGREGAAAPPALVLLPSVVTATAGVFRRPTLDSSFTLSRDRIGWFDELLGLTEAAARRHCAMARTSAVVVGTCSSQDCDTQPRRHHRDASLPHDDGRSSLASKETQTDQTFDDVVSAVAHALNTGDKTSPSNKGIQTSIDSSAPDAHQLTRNEDHAHRSECVVPPSRFTADTARDRAAATTAPNAVATGAPQSLTPELSSLWSDAAAIIGTVAPPPPPVLRGAASAVSAAAGGSTDTDPPSAARSSTMSESSAEWATTDEATDDSSSASSSASADAATPRTHDNYRDDASSINATSSETDTLMDEQRHVGRGDDDSLRGLVAWRRRVPLLTPAAPSFAMLPPPATGPHTPTSPHVSQPHAPEPAPRERGDSLTAVMMRDAEGQPTSCLGGLFAMLRAAKVEGLPPQLPTLDPTGRSVFSVGGAHATVTPHTAPHDAAAVAALHSESMAHERGATIMTAQPIHGDAMGYEQQHASEHEGNVDQTVAPTPPQPAVTAPNGYADADEALQPTRPSASDSVPPEPPVLELPSPSGRDAVAVNSSQHDENDDDAHTSLRKENPAVTYSHPKHAVAAQFPAAFPRERVYDDADCPVVTWHRRRSGEVEISGDGFVLEVFQRAEIQDDLGFYGMGNVGIARGKMVFEVCLELPRSEGDPSYSYGTGSDAKHNLLFPSFWCIGFATKDFRGRAGPVCPTLLLRSDGCMVVTSEAVRGIPFCAFPPEEPSPRTSWIAPPSARRFTDGDIVTARLPPAEWAGRITSRRVVTVDLDFNVGALRFGVDGVDVGIGAAFENVDDPEPLFPVVVFGGKSGRATMQRPSV